MNGSFQSDGFIIEAIDKYSDLLIRVSFSYMKNMSDAEDLAHDVFLKLMEKRPEFERRRPTFQAQWIWEARYIQSGM